MRHDPPAPPRHAQWSMLFVGAVVVSCNAVLGLDERPARQSAVAGGVGGDATGGSSSSPSAGGSGGVGGVGGDAGAGGTCTPTPDACGGVGELDDDFEDGAISIRWICPAQPGTSVTETGGAIEVQLPDTPVDYATGRCEARRFYDLVDRSIVVHVEEMVNTAVDVRAFFELFGVDGTRLSLQQRNHGWQVIVDPGGAPVVEASADYDDTQTWWRYREACGVLHWETSADGTVWNELYQAASSTLFDMRYARPRIGATVAPGVALPGKIRFSEIDGQPDTVACPIADFTDDFEDGALSNAWYAEDTSGCTVSESGGELLLVMQSANNSICHYASSTGFDMRDGAVSVRAVAYPGNGTAANSFLFASTQPGTGVVMGKELGLLFMGRVNNNNYVAIHALPFDAVDMAWWRLREAAGQTAFDTSPDGTTWTQRISVADPYDLSSVEVVLGSEVEANLPNGFDVRFDNLNLTP